MEGFDKDEIQQWEDELLTVTVKRMYKTEKIYKCPRKEKLIDYRRKKRSWSCRIYECTQVRRYNNRRFRRKMKRIRLDDDSVQLAPRPRDYKTY